MNTVNTLHIDIVYVLNLVVLAINLGCATHFVQQKDFSLATLHFGGFLFSLVILTVLGRRSG